jgi:N-acylglucosamine-6-phosphate 2-epimerase
MSSALLEKIRGGLVVSCQAPEGSPLRDPAILARIAMAAEDAGARAIRTEGIETVRAVKAAVSVPVIGLVKRTTNSPIYITPGVEDVRQLAEAGADIIALDATIRTREGGEEPEEFLHQAMEAAPHVLLMADIDDLASGLLAAQSGAHIVGTTLSGYTGDHIPANPDLELVSALAAAIDRPIIAEGRYTNAAQVKEAISRGALAVCIGTALTDPWTLTKRLVAEL